MKLVTTSLDGAKRAEGLAEVYLWVSLIAIADRPYGLYARTGL